MWNDWFLKGGLRFDLHGWNVRICNLVQDGSGLQITEASESGSSPNVILQAIPSQCQREAGYQKAIQSHRVTADDQLLSSNSYKQSNPMALKVQTPYQQQHMRIC